MKSVVEADSEVKAMIKLRKSIIIHYVREPNCSDSEFKDPDVEKLKKMFGMK